ncbi:hypothetical protein [Brevundimonas sp. FT23042]|uniref:hypothetical protein n=1 Tax=Brevundimonas sp. FT23042 TaxID=3393749 RepID=UPI003B587E9F
MNTARTDYLVAVTLLWIGLLTYTWVPAFKVVLGFWYFPGWVAISLIGAALSIVFRCPACDLPVAKQRVEFNGRTFYSYSFWPPRRCARCDEPLDD